MDLPIQVRSLDLMIKLLRHDLANIPSYGFRLQRGTQADGLKSSALPRSTPEAEGLGSSSLERIYRELDSRQLSVAPHALMILINGKVVSEGYWAPYRAEYPYMLYSMSKSITGTAIGIAIEEGLLSLDESLADIFPEFMPTNYLRQHKVVTVRQLLTMRTGNRFNEVGSMLDENWVKMFMESLPKFDPGTAFEYNSMNTYMLAAILVKKTGVPLMEYLRPRLFAPLGIEEVAWEVCPQGVEKGGWGLYLRLEDAAKLGQLYLQNGVWDGKRIVSEDWVHAATQSKATPLRATQAAATATRFGPKATAPTNLTGRLGSM